MTTFRKPGTVAGAPRAKEPTTQEKLQRDFDKLPNSVKRQLDYAITETREARLIRNSAGKDMSVGTTKIQLIPTESGMDELNKQYVAAHADLARAEPGSPAAKAAEMRVAQIEQSAQLQQRRNEQALRDANERDERELAGLKLDAHLLEERQRQTFLNKRRAKYGLGKLQTR